MLATICLLILLLTLLAAYPAMRARLQQTPRSKLHLKSIERLNALIIIFCLYGLFAGSMASPLLLGILFIGGLAFLFLAPDKKPVPSLKLNLDNEQLILEIDRLLPQTQCGQCNFPGCKPYATAIAQGKADINQCPPGGDEGIKALARLLNREVKALNPANGAIKPTMLAIIREPECIGCTKCIQACPVDAIIGAPKLMHTIIADLCTGCELCIPPCPMDCIDLIPADQNRQVNFSPIL
jgi:Na+-translocating ferredoxin:NAD+ oxidoreductase subunit B